MKVVTVLGSPRRDGASATIASAFVEEFRVRNEGVDSEIYYLNGLEAKGCQGCMACKSSSDKCILEDGMTLVLDSVAASDVVVLASPVYGGDITSQMKMFFDRMYSYLYPDFVTSKIKSRLNGGKKVVFINTQGSPEEIDTGVYNRYSAFLKWLGIFEESFQLRGCGLSEATESMIVPTVCGDARLLASRIKLD